MRRREFIAAIGSAAAAWPVVVRAQQGERARPVGVLTFNAEEDLAGTPIPNPLCDELQKLGWAEGRDLRLDFRFSNRDATQTHVFAADLARFVPDAIVTVYLEALRAAQQQTRTIPIIFASGGPVETGTVINSARQEGNVAGFVNAFGSLGRRSGWPSRNRFSRVPTR